MAATVGILLEFNYEDLEVWYPLLRLREEGHTVITIGPEEGKTYTSKHNYPCKADKSIADVNAQGLDCVICPGGWAPDYLRRDKRFVNLVREMVDTGKPVGSMCHGAWMLCSAKCLQGRKLTCFHAIRDDVENAGAVYSDAEVVVDGNLISSRVPADLPAFCKALIAALAARPGGGHGGDAAAAVTLPAKAD